MPYLLTGYVSIPGKFAKCFSNVDFPAPMLPSIETLKGLSTGVFINGYSFKGVIPTKVDLLIGDERTGLSAGRLFLLIAVIQSSIFVTLLQ